MTKKAFVIGDPIHHSLSPALHGFWLDEYGIDGSYEAINVPERYLAKTARKLADEGYIGGNITIPHKEKLLMMSDEIDDIAKKVGAVNTIKFDNGKIIGSNTDEYGFVENLKAAGTDLSAHKSALVLGAGGAARAIIVALQEHNIKVTISNRTFSKAENLAAEFGCDVLDWEGRSSLVGFDILVNTTALGMRGQEELEISLKTMPKNSVVADIVYNPLKTELLRQAEIYNLKTVDGLGMLLYQAIPGFEAWFGKRPQVTKQLREHVEICLKKQNPESLE